MSKRVIKSDYYLTLLWSAFPWAQCKSRCRQAQKCTSDKCQIPAARRIGLLKIAVNLKVANDRWDIKAGKRRDFEENMRPQGENNPNGRGCFVCGKPFNHRHHIIPIKNGGPNFSRNIVRLCAPCHREVHGH